VQNRARRNSGGMLNIQIHALKTMRRRYFPLLSPPISVLSGGEKFMRRQVVVVDDDDDDFFVVMIFDKFDEKVEVMEL